MRATRPATAALTLALSGSFTLGLVGTAAAGTHNTPTGRAPAFAPQDTDRTGRQIRTVKDLGRLAELTVTLGRVTRDGDSAALTRAVSERVDRKIRRVLADVEQDRPATTLPGTGEEGVTNSQVVTLKGASNSFRQTVRTVTHSSSGNAKSRHAASRKLLHRLAVVNRLTLNEVGLENVETRTPAPSFFAASPQAAITTTLIDRFAMSSDTSGQLRRHDDAIEVISDLVEDVRESRNGRLSQRKADEHAAEIDEALTPLRLRPGTRDDAGLHAEVVDELRERAHALLTASRNESPPTIRRETGRMVRETAKLLAAMPTGPKLSDRPEESDALDGLSLIGHGLDGDTDGERIMTGIMPPAMINR